MRKFEAAIVGIVLTVLIVGSALILGGTVALVQTHGNSMYPRITTGDLVLVAKQSAYHPGDVVAYHSRDLRQVVLHRVKAIHSGRYIFRGDHNDFDDPEQPTARQLIGRELVHVPGGGVWLNRLKAPHTLALIAFMLVAGGGSTAHKRRKLRRRPMAQHARLAMKPRRLGLSRTSTAVALVAAVLSVTGVALSGLAWRMPTTGTTSTPSDLGSRLTFSYRAEVPVSAAYRGTIVTAPDPLFRSLVDTVRLGYSYTGPPGTIRLDAEVSSLSGWHTRIPLQPTARFDQARTQGQVELDLDDLDDRAAAAAAAIEMPIDELTVAVVPTVRSADGGTFAPRLVFALTPAQFRLASEEPQLEFRSQTGPTVGAPKSNTVELAGRSVAVSTLRVGLAGLSAVALGVLMWVVLAGRQRSGNEARISSSKYSGLLLEVEPIISPPGRPIVDVADLAALLKLARRYGVLVMHWTRSQVRTFVVHDDGVTYRYRVDVTSGGASSTRPAASTVPRTRGRSPGALDEASSQG